MSSAYPPAWALMLAAAAILVSACHDSSNRSPPAQPVTETVPAVEDSVFTAANLCVAIELGGDGNFIRVNEAGSAYEVAAIPPEDATRFLLRPADLGVYLLYDENEQYMTSDGETLTRQSSLAFDTTVVDDVVYIEDRLQSEGEWQLIAAPDALFSLRHINHRQ